MVLDPQFEHALLLLDGNCTVERKLLAKKSLYYLGTCRKSFDINSLTGCKVILIGGPPFPEKILMWWNFIARTPEEIEQARADWETHHRFGEVKGTQLNHLHAPELTRLAHPNPIS